MERLLALRKKTAPLTRPRGRHEITATLPPLEKPPETLLREVYAADDQDAAIEAARQISSIDSARRIQAYVDIYSTFNEAMSEQDQHDLIDLILTDVLKFSGERLPDDAAQRAGIPDEYLTTSRATGIIDYADIEAVFRVWDEVVRSEGFASIIDAYLDQFAKISRSNAQQASLLKRAFKLSHADGTKAADNERGLLRQLQGTGSVNRFNDDKAQEEALRIAAERDKKRQLGRSVLQGVI